MSEDETDVVVIDNGSGMIKAGFAGYDEPHQLIDPSHFCEKISNSFAALKYSGQCYDPTQARPKSTKSTYPMKRGVVTDWDRMEVVWRNTFKQLQVETYEHSTFLTETMLTPKANREKMTQIMFEKFDVPALYLAVDSILALYASGRTTGTVLTSGYGITNITSIFEGYPLLHATQHLELAGQDITQFLEKLLTNKGYYCNSANYCDVIKEKLCYITQNYDVEMEKAEKSNNEIEEEYELPDGMLIQVGKERFSVPETLFQPNLINIKHDGIHKLIYSSIMKCDVDIRKDLYDNIVMSGGNTMYPGMNQRLITEISQMAPDLMKIKVIAQPERKYSVWVGGSILVGLSTFEEMWISKAEYDETGPLIVHKKCTM
eukprot:UN02673